MSAQKRTLGGALGAFVGFIGMSVVAGLLVTAAVTPAIAITGMAANNSIGVFEGIPEYLKIDSLAQNSTIYANQGGQPVPIATFYSQNRVEVPWTGISQLLKDASVATEDPRYYEHGGVDLMGTVRGALATYVLHKDMQGGSSITQQYVKNVRVQKCEVLNKKMQDPDPAVQKKKQESQDKKYKDCYFAAIQPTPARKLQEIKMAIGLEKKYSKNDILKGYLNIAGFGGQVYGVEAASEYYFNTTAQKINLQQAATLIAILNNPANLRIDQDKAANPNNNVENGFQHTLERRDYVLDRMYVNHKITLAQRDEAKKTKIETAITPKANGCASAAAYNAAFYCDWVQHLIQDDKALGKTSDDRSALLRRGGLHIYTPLNLDLQANAQQSLSDYVPATRDDVEIGGTNTSMELGTGRVITMVQNKPFDNTAEPAAGSTAINYNVDAVDGGGFGFQTGSTYKAFTLLEWLNEGRSINDSVTAPSADTTFPASRFHSTCDDAPTATWPNVGNDSSGEGGTMSVSSATALSVNTAFAVMSTKLDLCGILNTAKSLGVHLAYPYDLDGNPRALGGSPATVLGTNEIAPLTMAAAYAGIANNGKFCTPIGIDKITDSNGKALPVTPTTCTQAIDPNVAAGAATALQRVMSGGTASSANPRDGTPILGKTGTTDHAAQNWLVTSTSKVASATWVGQTQKMPGASDFVDFGRLNFNGTNGRNVKLQVMRPILAAIDAAYGGDSFPRATGSAVNVKKVTVPDVTGQTPEQAQSTLENMGFAYQFGGPIDSAAPAGTVASTDPAAGVSVGIGGSVTVYASNASLVALPDVTGKRVSDAIKSLTAAGFGYQYSGNPNATVASTDPAPGTPTKPGTKVKLTTKGGG